MSKKANPRVVGVFVVGAVLLAVACVIVFGSGKFFEKTTKCVMYFEGSLGGLDVGAPVEFRGVKVGTVSDITLIYDARDGNFRIPVVVDLQTGAAVQVGGIPPSDEEAGIQALIERGLKGRLVSQSMVTGKLKIELGFFPEQPAALVRNDTDYTQIPTLPKALDVITKKLQDLPLTDIVQDLYKTIHGLSEVINTEETKQTLVNLNATLTQLREMLGTLQQDLPPLTRNLAESADAAAASLRQIESMLDTDSPLRYESVKALRELTRTAETLRVFLDTLERDPGALLHGKSN